MSASLLSVAIAVTMQVGTPAPAETPNFPAMQNAFSHHGFEGQYEQRYPFDTQQNWVHGYFQEIPAYGGHAFYRPYNYKDVLSQSQTAAGWGASPQMPYSQQFWHRYQDRATMLKLSSQTPHPHPGMVAAPTHPSNQQLIQPVNGHMQPGMVHPAAANGMYSSQAGASGYPAGAVVYYPAANSSMPMGAPHVGTPHYGITQAGPHGPGMHTGFVPNQGVPQGTYWEMQMGDSGAPLQYHPAPIYSAQNYTSQMSQPTLPQQVMPQYAAPQYVPAGNQPVSGPALTVPQ